MRSISICFQLRFLSFLIWICPCEFCIFHVPIVIIKCMEAQMKFVKKNSTTIKNGCGLVIVSSKWFKTLFPSPSTSWPENNAMIGCWSAWLGFRLIWLGPIWKRGRLLVGRSRGEVGGRPIRSPLPAPHLATCCRCATMLHVDVLHVDTCYM